MTHSLTDDLNLATQAAREAGRVLMSFYKSEYEVQAKGEDNPLTEADLASDGAIKTILRAERPADGWLSEETADSAERLSRDRVWIVDPLDGTKEFIQGVPQFSVSIGLVDQGRPVLGVVYNPVTDELFAGAVGEGATLNGAPIQASDTSDARGAVLLASRSEVQRGEFALFEEDYDIQAVGSIAYKLALVAAGRGDASFSLGPKHEWDVCAGVALILAAGGCATDRTGQPLVFNQKVTLTNGILSANRHLHGPIVQQCQPLLAQFAHRFTERDPR